MKIPRNLIIKKIWRDYFKTFARHILDAIGAPIHYRFPPNLTSFTYIDFSLKLNFYCYENFSIFNFGVTKNPMPGADHYCHEEAPVRAWKSWKNSKVWRRVPGFARRSSRLGGVRQLGGAWVQKEPRGQ